MTGPLVPVPSLPHRGGTGVVVGRVGSMARVSIDNGSIPFAQATDVDAPALAAAILSAAGLEHHRVIDLGGPLPSVEKDDGNWYARFPEGGVARYHNSADEVLVGVRGRLAVLEAMGATSAHDPAEVEAINAAFAKYGRRDVDAESILDALAAVRSGATS